MSADSTVTYTSVHSEARSWSIPFEDPYEEATRQLLEQAPRSIEYVPDPIELEDHVPFHILEHPEDLVPADDEAYILKVASAPTPPLPPSFLSPRIRPLHTRATMAQMRAVVPSTYHSLLPSGTPPLLPIPLPVPSTSRRVEIPEADTPPRKRLLLTAPRPGCEVRESSTAAAARQPGPTTARSVDCSFVDTMETRFQDRAAVRAKIEVLRRERLAYEQESIQIREALTKSEAYIRTLEARVVVLETQAHRHEWQRVAAAMDEAEASRVRNGNDSNGLGPRQAQAVRECIYPDFLKCQPLNIKGTEGVVGLTQWSRFYMVEPHVKTVTLEVAQALTWKTLKKMMTDKYCPRGKIKKLETEIWELKTKGTDVIGYSRHFQELAMMCDRMFPEESDRVEKYIGGLPDTIHDSVKATRPKTMQEAIEFATELMDKKIHTFAKRQTENKRKQDDNNNQAQQQPLKKQGVAIAYTAGLGERKEYAYHCATSTSFITMASAL
uniref:Ty3 transposon capsid-like protein domain-containing protein n=1 Tax=Tanacetum cinerariifolium TaxID=118510 RepID=A0A699I2Q2_TANCI|nr:hypothetical protein [Tanacetum cinerariifolium]